MSLHTAGEPTADERIYHFRCRCGRCGTRRSRSRLVRVTCRDCSADVEWWQSTALTPFVKPEISIELTKEQIDEIRADRATWASLSRKTVVGPEDDRDSAPHAANAPAPACTTTAIRDAAHAVVSDDREQLALGDFLVAKDQGI